MAESAVAALLPALSWLEARIEWKAAAEGVRGTVAATHPDTTLDGLEPGDRLAWLSAAFGLDSFERAVVLLLSAMELDSRYAEVLRAARAERGAVPSVGCALWLLCDDAPERIVRRDCFSFDAPLVRHGLVLLTPAATRLQCGLRIAPQILDYVLDTDRIDERLAGRARRWPGSERDDWVNHVGQRAHAIQAAARAAQQRDGRLTIYLQAPTTAGRHAARSLAKALRARVLELDLRDVADVPTTVRVAARQAWLDDDVLLLEGIDPGSRQCDQSLDALAEYPGVTVLRGAPPWRTDGELPVVPLSLAQPAQRERADLWRQAAADAGLSISDTCIRLLATRYRVGLSSIAAAAQDAALQRTIRSRPTPHDDDQLLSSARGLVGRHLEQMAQRIEPRRRWDSLVLPPEPDRQLHEFAARVTHAETVLRDWGFASRLGNGTAPVALFSGPSGCGKTLAAEVVAAEVGADLFCVNLGGVVSKYIGETESNLERIFTAASDGAGLLFFDEADALFGKRSEVREAHDRYANLEVSYLLQRIEQFDGPGVVLASNNKTNLDEAFLRRFSMVVHFPIPDVESLQRIWRCIWPAGTPKAADLDLDLLARRHRLTGGNVRNIALAAAFYAAEERAAVGMAHVERALLCEMQKLGSNPLLLNRVPPRAAAGRG